MVIRNPNVRSQRFPLASCALTAATLKATVQSHATSRLLKALNTFRWDTGDENRPIQRTTRMTNIAGAAKGVNLRADCLCATDQLTRNTI